MINENYLYIAGGICVIVAAICFGIIVMRAIRNIRLANAEFDKEFQERRKRFREQQARVCRNIEQGFDCRLIHSRQRPGESKS